MSVKIDAEIEDGEIFYWASADVCICKGTVNIQNVSVTDEYSNTTKRKPFCELPEGIQKRLIDEALELANS